MSSCVFSCHSDIDIAFIPFMPATTEDNVELRVQIRTKSAGAPLDAVILIDGNEIHSVKKYPVERFFFFSDVRRYTEGEHLLSVRFKESGKEELEETSIPFFIEKERRPLLSGGFVMLGPPNDRKPCENFIRSTKQMSDEDWENYLTELSRLGIKCIIITATVQLRTMNGENTAHYPSKLYPRSDIEAADPVRAILRSAEKNGQHVFVGLSHTYHGSISNTAEVMAELYSLYGDSPAFYGWYESKEGNMRRNKDELFERWKYLRECATSLSPVKPFIVSPYADGKNIYHETGGINPEFLERVANGDGAFDIIAPQDMVGHTIKGGRLTVKESAEMYRHLSLACRKAKKHLWANCEAFDFDDELRLVPRFNGGGMNGENGYIQQIEAVNPYSEKIVTFMLNGFFSPKNFTPVIGGERAVKQCEDYRAYYDSLKK